MSPSRCACRVPIGRGWVRGGALFVAALWFASAPLCRAGALYTVYGGSGWLLTSVDTDTLARTTIGPLGVSFAFGGLAYAQSTDTLYLIGGRDNQRLYTVDRTTGAASLVGFHGVQDLFGLEWDPSTGWLYASAYSSADQGFYRLDPATGAATAVKQPNLPGIGGLAYDGKRDQLVGVADGYGNLYSIDRPTGDMTLLFDGSYTNNSGLAYDYDKDLFWDLDYDGKLRTYDPSAGYAEVLRMTYGGVHDGLAYVGSPQSVVPEPGTLALLGLGGLAVARRKRRR